MIHIFDHLRRQKTFHLQSKGTSMLPVLQPDDIVSYRKASFTQCRVNDIVLVRKKGNMFTHRVIYKSKNYLIPNGDNNGTSDGKIFPRQIIAKAYQIKRNGQLLNPENIYLFQSTLYFKEIVKIKKLFEREKIDFVFLKGLPLHLYYEKSHPKRLYLDCDVLVDANDFLKAEKILFRSDYKKAQTELSELHKKIKDKEVENAYYKIINGFQVVFDLHVEVVFMMTQLGKLEALYPQKLIDSITSSFLENKRTVKIENEPFPILDTESLVIYLSLHFFHHNFKGAFRLELLDRIIRKSYLSSKKWLQINKRICDYQLQNFVYPVFFLLNKYYETPIPKSFMKRVTVNVFDDEPRIQAGITRFKNLLFLSPRPLLRRLLILVNPQVLYSIFWVGWRKLSSLL